MNFRSFFPVVFLLISHSFLPAQEAEPDSTALFPLNLLLDAARSGAILWQPDWPAAMPPDAFSLITGQARSLTLTLPAGILDTANAEVFGDAVASAGLANSPAAVPGEIPNTGTAGNAAEGEAATLEYRITRDAGGRFLEFPFFRDGIFYQAAVVYDDAVPERIGKITLDNPAASDPWEFEFLEYTREDPSLVRINAGGSWFFAVPEYLNRRTNETWYDPDGLAQAFFALEYREADGKKQLFSINSRSDQADGETGAEAITTYDYNSSGRISSVDAPAPSSALYTAAARPRYWERPDARYTLQWDETGFLSRQTTDQELDIRYEYTLDERLNWTERREIPLTRRFGRLIPGGGMVIRRNITYGDGNE